MEQKTEQVVAKQKIPDGIIPIGKQNATFYFGIVYNELSKNNKVTLISRGDNNIAKVLSIVTDLISDKIASLNNNEVLIKFEKAININKREVMLPSISLELKKI